MKKYEDNFWENRLKPMIVIGLLAVIIVLIVEALRML